MTAHDRNTGASSDGRTRDCGSRDSGSIPGPLTTPDEIEALAVALEAIGKFGMLQVERIKATQAATALRELAEENDRLEKLLEIGRDLVSSHKLTNFIIGTERDALAQRAAELEAERDDG